MHETVYVAIEGPIGVGKTTLARLLHKQLEAELLLEVFEENPFLSDFYADRAKYAFQTQVFFLLSRYRQQHQLLNRALLHSSVVSDYAFAKDQLFARLNLVGDELGVYETLHSLLAEKIALPDLIVYLHADLDVLLERIAIRDRPYERSMSQDYMAAVTHAYETFFAAYHQAPVLAIDTNDLNIVRSREDLQRVLERIKAALELSTVQREDLETPAQEQTRVVMEGRRRRLRDLQGWSQVVARQDGNLQNPFLDYVGLQAALGDIAVELQRSWADGWPKDTAGYHGGVRDGLDDRAEVLGTRLADALAGILRLANDLGIGLEEAFLARMCGGNEPRRR